MIVADTSALLAILFAEPDAAVFADVLNAADVYLPASVLVEAGILAHNRNRYRDLVRLLDALEPMIVPIDQEVASLAVEAHQNFGKGRHRAQLNFGDCLVYATAKNLSMRLLFKGDDFNHTDIEVAQR